MGLSQSETEELLRLAKGVTMIDRDHWMTLLLNMRPPTGTCAYSRSGGSRHRKSYYSLKRSLNL